MVLMVRLLLVFVFLGFGLAVSAQDNPVLMRINGKEIYRSEFERSYNKSSFSVGTDRKSLEAYANKFIDFRLKIEAAEVAGLDTSRVFRKEQDDYRRCLIKSYLTDEETAEQAARQYYDRMKSGRRAGRVYVKHIFKYLPQNISGHTLREMESGMDSIYKTLAKEEGGASSFDACVEQYSDEKKAFWVGWLQMPVEFEDIVFGLNVGEISRPFLTPQGIHIVKVLEQRDVLPFENMKDEIIRCQSRRHGMDKGTRAFVEKLKKEYHYMPDKAGIDELLAKGSTSRALFTLDGKAYGGKEFAGFAAAYPTGTRRQLEAFTVKTILDYENSRLELKHPEFCELLQGHRDSMLLAEITDREVEKRSVADEAGLKAYFEAHRSDFHWDKPRYKGIVLHCTTKRVAKQVRKFLKQIPEEEWVDAIRLTFNAGDTPKMQVEQGLFAPGDNAYVDDLVFKGKDATPVLSFPFTAVQGRKQKGPDSWQEVRGPLADAYRNYLETRWVAKLRAAAKVEIDQEVLKTVNNH
ncbi:peptidylprolyl isomerase [Bacteroides muris (ex Afrizal et al. 2022)]|uniref:Peptidylprolyl isomerase n=1 Tax=Bacteroides muris (ex Afrizal et al. 2022) TaxID=2516960 RepID=A0A4S2AKE1_9BACE|nr:peptidyl-prolyl cis-trans isomerase [Bacteroides muris (ex Afrizal et al. 2022)]TGY01365.1 peptidylprolyl isomerase [Bacteroides muris (ex Afrizal et al. 2022)]